MSAPCVFPPSLSGFGTLCHALQSEGGGLRHKRDITLPSESCPLHDLWPSCVGRTLHCSSANFCLSNCLNFVFWKRNRITPGQRTGLEEKMYQVSQGPGMTCYSTSSHYPLLVPLLGLLLFVGFRLWYYSKGSSIDDRNVSMEQRPNTEELK